MRRQRARAARHSSRGEHVIRPQRIDLWDIELPLVREFTNAGQTLASRRSVMVLMRTEGFRGWAEAPIVPGHTRDTADEAFDLMHSEAGRIILGAEPVLIEGSAGTSALDAALFALNAHAEGKSLAEAAGATGGPVTASLAIGITTTLTDLLETVEKAEADGYRHVKLKISPDTLDRVAMVRRRFPELGIAIDGNGAFRRRDLESLVSLDRYRLDYMEQPLPALDIAGHAPLQRLIQTPIALDESVRRLGDIVTAATVGAALAVTLKPGRLGPTLTRRAITLAVRHGLEVRMGSLLETGIGRTHVLALAGRPEVTLPTDLTPSGHWYANDLLTLPMDMINGEFAQLNEPNLDRLVDRHSIRQLAHRHVFVPD